VVFQSMLAPPRLELVEPTPAGVHLAWSRQYGVDRYSILRDGHVLASLACDQTSYDDLATQPGETHTYQLSAANALGGQFSPVHRAYRWPWPAYFLTSTVGGSGPELADLGSG